MQAINGISASTHTGGLFESLLNRTVDKPADDKLEARQAFQDFVAGTFYKQMLKSLRDTLDRPAYFHGGRGEDVFQSQLDQQVAEDLAANQGAPLVDDLYEAFLHNRRA